MEKTLLYSRYIAFIAGVALIVFLVFDIKKTHEEIKKGNTTVAANASSTEAANKPTAKKLEGKDLMVFQEIMGVITPPFATVDPNTSMGVSCKGDECLSGDNYSAMMKMVRVLESLPYKVTLDELCIGNKCTGGEFSFKFTAERYI